MGLPMLNELVNAHEVSQSPFFELLTEVVSPLQSSSAEYGQHSESCINKLNSTVSAVVEGAKCEKLGVRKEWKAHSSVVKCKFQKKSTKKNKFKKVKVLLSKETNYLLSAMPLEKLLSDDLLDMMNCVLEKRAKVQENTRQEVLLGATFRLLNEALTEKCEIMRRQSEEIGMQLAALGYNAEERKTDVAEKVEMTVKTSLD